MLPSPDENPEVLDAAVQEALDGETLRSHDWKQLVSALETRRKRLKIDLADADDVDALLIQARVDEINEQIRLLEEEAKISRFVEDTVKFSYEVRRLNEG